MYKPNKANRTTLSVCNVVEGERIEVKMERVLTNGEPIKDGSQELIYTERKDGVHPAYDIRTDRFDMAIDAMDKVTASNLAKREQRIKVVKDEPKGEEPGGQSIGATN